MTLIDKLTEAVYDGCSVYEVSGACSACEMHIKDMWDLLGPIQDQILRLRRLVRSGTAPTLAQLAIILDIEDQPLTAPTERTS